MTWWQVCLIAVCVMGAVIVVASALAILAHWLGGVRSATGTYGRRFLT